MGYEDANATLRREACYETAAGNGAVSAKFAHFQKMRLVAVHAQVTVAGTSAGAGNSLVIKHGATAIGTFTLGTSTARTSVSLDMADRAIAALEDLTATNGTDATGRALVVYEFKVDHDAVRSS